MSLTRSQSEPEIIPPASSAPAEAYSPEQARRHREFSVWDPRSAPGTYLLLSINCAVYLWMITHGVSPKDPSDAALLHYGANSTWYVLHGQWYRLLTAIFLHIGLLHIATNMWCLWNLGILGEPLIGPWGMVAVYLITGIAGNLLSMASNVVATLYTHDPRYLLEMGAGASGAVFGIAGILIILLSNRKLPVPWSELKRLRKSVIWFAAINLIAGVGINFTNIVRIDNFAHLGGFTSGLLLGLPLLPRMTSGRESYLGRQKVVFSIAAFFLALFGYWIAHLI